MFGGGGGGGAGGGSGGGWLRNALGGKGNRRSTQVQPEGEYSLGMSVFPDFAGLHAFMKSRFPHFALHFLSPMNLV